MDRLRLASVSLALVALAGITGCGPSEREAPKPAAPQAAAPAAPPAPPSPAAAPAPAADVNAELARLAAEVWVFAYPLVVTDVTRQVRSPGVAPNTFVHRRSLPDASSPGPDPNADFLASEAWLDLSKGPVMLSVPDAKNRYYLIELHDAWSNAAGSIGTRNTGSAKGEFAIVGPHWKGQLPEGVSEVRSPTDLAWLKGRTEVRGAADLAAAVKMQEQFRLQPLSQRGKPPGKAGDAAKEAGVDARTDPREQVARMDAPTFFSRLAALLPANPLAKDDAPMADKLAKLGVVAGKPFDASKLDAVAARSLEQGLKTAQDAVSKGTKGLGGADIRNGWTIDRDVGRWGTDYGKRAVAAMKGLGVTAPEDAISMATRLDGGGQPLDGNARYVLRFEPGKSPPTDAFWSVSLYDPQRRFVANAVHHYGLGSNGRLAKGPDGSVEVVLQPADPGPEKASNWLPTPKGPFNLVLRIYSPRQEVLDSKWVPPGIRRVS